MPHAIEHPEKFLGPQNKHVLDTLADAYQVALSLGSWGCTVETITSKRGKPVIWIKATGECQQLQSYICQYGRDTIGPYQIHRAEENGCLINWKTRVAA